MDKSVFIVHPNSDMFLTISDILKEIEPQGYRFYERWAKTAMEALRKSFSAAEAFDLLITAVEIPESTKLSAGAGEQCRWGLELVRTFRAKSPGMAAILVLAGQPDHDLVAFTKSEECSCGLVVEGKGFQENLTNEIIKHVGPHKPEAPSRVNLEINLAKGYSYYQFQREGREPESAHQLTVTPSVLRELVDESLRI